MAETSDYDPGDWRGHDFKSAYKDYDRHAGRAYDDAVAAGAVSPTDLVPATLSTDSDAPLVVMLDGTGSMSDWPRVIFSKLPYLDIEGKTYLGDNMATSFCVYSDACSPGRAVMQVKPFVKGLEMEKTLKEMFIPGGGGGGTEESAELAMLFYARNCEIPNAVKPIALICTDEKSYEWVDKGDAQKYAHVDTSDETRLSTHKVVRELQRKFNVYAIIKPYSGGATDTDPTTIAVRNHWVGLLGEDHVVSLPDPNRVVDVIFGIMAKETGKIDYFKGELTDRQKKDVGGDKKIDVVLTSLNTVHKDAAKSIKKLPGATAKPGASVTKRTGTGKGSISLLDD
jgi:hypothetical protein